MSALFRNPYIQCYHFKPYLSNFSIVYFFRGIYQTLPIYGALVSVDRQFYEGTHHIEYRTVDDGGNVDSCKFKVIVSG